LNPGGFTGKGGAIRLMHAHMHAPWLLPCDASNWPKTLPEGRLPWNEALELAHIETWVTNKRRDYKKGTVCGWRDTCSQEKSEWRRWRLKTMVDGLCVFIWNRTMKPLANAVSGSGKDLRGEDGGSDLTNVQCKSVQNCHNESSCTMNTFSLFLKRTLCQKNIFVKYPILGLSYSLVVRKNQTSRASQINMVLMVPECVSCETWKGKTS
jgi:hypothetical protein